MEMTLHEAVQLWRSHTAQRERMGIHLPEAYGYATDAIKHDYTLAMDALPTPVTTANAGVPALLTTFIDPDLVRILFAPMKAADIIGEEKKGDWLMETAMFPVIEPTGEVSSYGDFNNNGHAGVNVNWPQRQSYRYQVVKEYGELELERAGLARVNWVTELDRAAALSLNKFQNFTYFFGLNGLQNYGLLNDPSLSAALTPATKTGGGVAWINSSTGQIVATANEVYADIQALFGQLVKQTRGLVTKDDELILAMSPDSAVALTATNSFNVNVADLIKKNFPRVRVEQATQYGAINSINPSQGIAAGNMVQMIAPEVEGQRTAYCAFTEKMRAHKIIPEMSAYKQKISGGTWGAIVRYPVGIAAMVGV